MIDTLIILLTGLACLWVAIRATDLDARLPWLSETVDPKHDEDSPMVIESGRVSWREKVSDEGRAAVGQGANSWRSRRNAP